MNKHDSRDYLHYKNRRTDYICYANCTVEAESALNSQSANNDKKQLSGKGIEQVSHSEIFKFQDVIKIKNKTIIFL